MGLPVKVDNQAPPLTGLQHQFVSLYLSQCKGDAVAAVQMMGLSDDNRVVRRLANRLLGHPAVQWHINRYASQHMAPTEILALLAAHARGDIGDFYDESEEDGRPVFNLRRAKELGITRLIRKFKTSKDGTVEVELYDALAAAQALARITGLYQKDSNVHLVIEHVMRGLNDDVRTEVLAALGGLLGGSGGEVLEGDVIVSEDLQVALDAEAADG